MFSQTLMNQSILKIFFIKKILNEKQKTEEVNPITKFNQEFIEVKNKLDLKNAITKYPEIAHYYQPMFFFSSAPNPNLPKFLFERQYNESYSIFEN